MNWLTKRLVDGWQQSWRWWSVQQHLVGTIIVGALVMAPSMPQELQGLVPAKYRAIAIGLWFVLGLLARLKRQGS